MQKKLLLFSLLACLVLTAFTDKKSEEKKICGPWFTLANNCNGNTIQHLNVGYGGTIYNFSNINLQNGQSIPIGQGWQLGQYFFTFFFQGNFIEGSIRIKDGNDNIVYCTSFTGKLKQTIIYSFNTCDHYTIEITFDLC